MLDHCLEEASLLLKTLSKKEIKAYNLHLIVIRSSIALVLSLMSRIDSVSKGSQEVDQLSQEVDQLSQEVDQLVTCTLTKAVEMIHDFLNTWIKRVIGSVLGGVSHKGKPLPVSTRLKRETEVHDCILFVITNASVHNADLMQLWQDLLELKCPPSVVQDWHGVVETIVTKRVKHLSPEDHIDMLCELENGSNTSSSCTLITKIFITESIAALEELMLSEVCINVSIHYPLYLA